MAGIVNYLVRADAEIERLKGEAEDIGQMTLAFLLELARSEIEDELRLARGSAARPGARHRGLPITAGRGVARTAIISSRRGTATANKANES